MNSSIIAIRGKMINRRLFHAVPTFMVTLPIYDMNIKRYIQQQGRLRRCIIITITNIFSIPFVILFIWNPNVGIVSELNWPFYFIKWNVMRSESITFHVKHVMIIFISILKEH